VWQTFPIDVRGNALLAESFGIGTASIEYQAQLENWVWEDFGRNLSGLPIVHYTLLLTNQGRRRGLLCASQYMADSHLARVKVFTNNQFNLAPPIGLKKAVGQSRAMPIIAPPAVTPNFMSPEDLSATICERYCTVAKQIKSEIQTQLTGNVSDLGKAVFALTRTTELIRGAAAWLLSDKVASNSTLRASLFGGAEGWARYDLGWSVLEDQKRWRTVVPLLDADTLARLMQMGDIQDPDDPAQWTELHLLANLSAVVDASCVSLQDAIQNCERSSIGVLPDEANLLAQLKLHQRYFGEDEPM